MTPQEMKTKRKARNLTQAELAKRIGITVRHYNRLETGAAPLTPIMQKVVRMELEAA